MSASPEPWLSPDSTACLIRGNDVAQSSSISDNPKPDGKESAPEAGSSFSRSNTVELEMITRVLQSSLKIVPIENPFIEHLQRKREVAYPSLALYKSTPRTTTHAPKEAT
jgi:hypothetical protein